MLRQQFLEVSLSKLYYLLLIANKILSGAVTELHVQRTYQYKFDQIRAKFGVLIHTVAPLIESAVISKLKEFKKFLGRCFQELKPQLSVAECFDDVMELVEEKCTIINVCCLETIVKQYNIKEAKGHIAKYNLEVDELCKEIKVSVCENENFMTSSSSFLKCETIKLVLEWEPDEYYLNQISDILVKAFQDMAKRVQVRVIKKDNSITVTCYAPRNIMDILLMEAEKNLDVLIKMGLIKLSIGYHIVCDICGRDKV